jgi:hypothetical protein
MVISLQKGRLIGLAAVPRNRSTIYDTGGSGKGHGAHVSIKHPKVQDRSAIQLVPAASSACLYSQAVLRWPLPHCWYSCVNLHRTSQERFECKLQFAVGILRTRPELYRPYRGMRPGPTGIHGVGDATPGPGPSGLRPLKILAGATDNPFDSGNPSPERKSNEHGHILG